MNQYSMARSNQKAGHTQQVIAELNEVLAMLNTAATAERRFVITGDEKFLEPYHATLPATGDPVLWVQELVEDSPLQYQNIQLLSEKAALKLTRQVGRRV